MPEWTLTGLFVALCSFGVLYGAWWGMNKAIDWMIGKIFYSGGD